MASDDEKYQNTLRLAEVAAQEIRRLIQEALGRLGDPYLIRARIDPWRPKSLTSLARKARQRGWDFDKALERAEDIVGFRLVCHNVQDAQRLASLLVES